MMDPDNTVITDAWGKKTEKHMGKDSSWRQQMFSDKIPWNYDKFREVLEKYSNIPPDQVEAEIFRIRDRAWEIAQYPCIGSFTYVRLHEFSEDRPEMQNAIERLRAPGSDETFLEIGGFMCQTLRRLVFEGVDSAKLYGTDLHIEFFELGYDQFRDRDTLKATFVAGDMLLPADEYASSSLPKILNGKISIAHAANFFHLFDWESQLTICERIARFFRRGSNPARPAVLFGSHIGTTMAGEVRVGGTFRVFSHDQKTFQSLWDEVGKKTATRWSVTWQTVGTSPPRPNVYGDNARVVCYIVREVLS
ncbi:hypothetical protein F5Y19DRAFT_463900 [Xylariaceae sp. FL1651]|nr:hypothetical protein F5Y19DRAFT_463900 [Xylariaceae sp. FL1651]